MTPDKIPDDIARTARALADEMLDRYLDMGLVSSLPHIERDIAALAIAKVIDAAVKAERERAAQLSDNLAKHALAMDGGRMKDTDYCWYAVRNQAEGLAAAIRGDAT